MAKVGRPSDYKEEYCNKVAEYLKTTGREQTKLPTIEGFCLYIGIPRRTVYEWKDAHEEFSHTLDLILMVQKEQLTNDGIYGGKEVNATIVKLMLQNNHGMKERQDLTSGDEKLKNPNLSYEELKKIAREEAEALGLVSENDGGDQENGETQTS